jgi:hypothetical protein
VLLPGELLPAPTLPLLPLGTRWSETIKYRSYPDAYPLILLLPLLLHQWCEDSPFSTALLNCTSDGQVLSSRRISRNLLGVLGGVRLGEDEGGGTSTNALEGGVVDGVGELVASTVDGVGQVDTLRVEVFGVEVFVAGINYGPGCI